MSQFPFNLRSNYNLIFYRTTTTAPPNDAVITGMLLKCKYFHLESFENFRDSYFKKYLLRRRRRSLHRCAGFGLHLFLSEEPLRQGSRRPASRQPLPVGSENLQEDLWPVLAIFTLSMIEVCSIYERCMVLLLGTIKNKDFFLF